MDGCPQVSTVTKKSSSCYVLHKVKGKCRGKDGVFHYQLAEARLKHGSAVLCSRCFPTVSAWNKHVGKVRKSAKVQLKRDHKPPLKKPKKSAKVKAKAATKSRAKPKARKKKIDTPTKPKKGKKSRKKAHRECSVCHKTGHNARTCTKKGKGKKSRSR